jgi:hypothetical protein
MVKPHGPSKAVLLPHDFLRDFTKPKSFKLQLEGRFSVLQPHHLISISKQIALAIVLMQLE